MSEDYKAKIFKSGNSLALRLPKALGLEEGAEMTLRENHGTYTFEPVHAAPRKIDLTGIAGSMPWLMPLSRDDRAFQERDLDWDGAQSRRG